MDKEEFKIKLDLIDELVDKKDYKEALDVVDSIDWRRVKNVRTLCKVGEIYAANKRYKESREIFLLAYHRSSVGKTILYRLIEVSIKLGDLDEALEYYSDFVETAPNDSTQYVLKYKIYSARKAPLEEQIQILEEYKDKEFTERWAYELARLYYQTGQKDKCADICDELVLWFREGKYVSKALELKGSFRELTPSQKKIYDKSFHVDAVEKIVSSKDESLIQDDSKEIIEESPLAEPSMEDDKFVEEVDEEEFSEEKSFEEIQASAILIGDEFKQKISEGIKDIFHKNDVVVEENEDDKIEDDLVDKQITGQINLLDYIPESVPSLEPEDINTTTFPKLEIPQVNLNESAKVEDLPVEDNFSINLEDSIIAAAQAQGIDLPEESLEEDTISEEVAGEEITEEEIPSEDLVEEFTEEPAVEEPLSEEQELMNFIDEQNKDPNVSEDDIIPREDKLDDTEIKIFKYFSSVLGMKEQIIEALKGAQESAAYKTSSMGNIIVMGNIGCGKSMLSLALVKAICRELNMPAAKMAKISATQLNEQDIAKVVDKLTGGFLLIDNTNQLTEDTVEKLNKAMDFRTDGLTVILEDEKINMRKFIARNDKFIKKFTSTISIPVFTNDELVNFAKVYSNESGYKIDEMGVLALYSLISDNQKEDQPMTVDGVRELIDNAIVKAESGTRKLQRNLSKTRTDSDGLIVLYEKDFK